MFLKPQVPELPHTPHLQSPFPSASSNKLLPLIGHILKSVPVTSQMGHMALGEVSTLEQSAACREDRSHGATSFSARAGQGPQREATYVASPAMYNTQQLHQVLRDPCE